MHTAVTCLLACECETERRARYTHRNVLILTKKSQAYMYLLFMEGENCWSMKAYIIEAQLPINQKT